MTTDQQFADWLRSLPRERSADQVARTERQHDTERNPWGVADHHEYGEARH